MSCQAGRMPSWACRAQDARKQPPPRDCQLCWVRMEFGVRLLGGGRPEKCHRHSLLYGSTGRGQAGRESRLLKSRRELSFSVGEVQQKGLRARNPSRPSLSPRRSAISPCLRPRLQEEIQEPAGGGESDPVSPSVTSHTSFDLLHLGFLI